MSKKEVIARHDMPVRGVKKGETFKVPSDEISALEDDGWIEPQPEKGSQKPKKTAKAKSEAANGAASNADAASSENEQVTSEEGDEAEAGDGSSGASDDGSSPEDENA